MYAAAKNNTEMVRLLLDKGANVDAKNTVSPAFSHRIGHDARISLDNGEGFLRFLP